MAEYKLSYESQLVRSEGQIASISSRPHHDTTLDHTNMLTPSRTSTTPPTATNPMTRVTGNPPLFADQHSPP
jgi:hypothetical protein